MTLKSQLYLLQLEDYDIERYQQWISIHPNQEVVEKKGKLRWSPKARLLFFLAKMTGSILLASKLLNPFDYLFKKLIVGIAYLKLRLLHPNLIVIGITGSWGKTTAKEKIAELLVQKYQIYRTPANRNTLLGVADTVLRIPLKTKIFICEMGAYKKGDIKDICELVLPKIGIITAIGPMHLERFGSINEIKKAKYELFDAIQKGGIKIEPGENYLEKISSYFDVNLTNKFSDVSHRLEIIQTNGLTIIDDTYNSNPAGFLLALEKLESTPGAPKILITPGMIELGHLQFEENEKIALISSKVCDWIIFIGETNKLAWQKGLKNYKNKIFVTDIDEAKKELTKYTKIGAVVLLENDLPDNYF